MNIISLKKKINSKKRFLYWVVYFPLGIIIFFYVVELFSTATSWFYAEPESKFASAQSILTGGRDFDEFLRLELRLVIFAMILGSGVWLYEYYSKKELKN